MEIRILIMKWLQCLLLESVDEDHDLGVIVRKSLKVDAVCKSI